MTGHGRQPFTMDSHLQTSSIASANMRYETPRMQYRNRPVTVAVDPISLVISECISITSAIQKHARSPNTSVSAILGGNPNSIDLGASNSLSKTRIKGQSARNSGDGSDPTSNNRWGLRGQKGKSMQDNPMISGFSQLRHDLSGVKGE